VTNDPFEYIVQGDIEAACVDILRSASEVTTLCPTNNISTDLVGYQLGVPWVMVERQGGARRYPYITAKPRVDFECRAMTRADAHDLAQVCLAVVIRESTRYAGKGVRLMNAKVETDIYRHYDKPDEAVIYIFALRLTVRPGPA